VSSTNFDLKFVRNVAKETNYSIRASQIRENERFISLFLNAFLAVAIICTPYSNLSTLAKSNLLII
jgi:hypothetical protein